MDWLTDPGAWIALTTLTALEIVLGIDNIIFISILAGKLPEKERHRARLTGLLLAMFMRIALLFSLSLIMRLTNPWFVVFGNEISGRDLILIIGGLFLLAKSTHEIHNRLEGEEHHRASKSTASFAAAMVQIVLLDVVFSLDSVITALGMANRLAIMVVAVILAVAFMMVFAKAVSEFVDAHPTVKMLALSFLLLIGVALIADGLDRHIPKGYIYFSMAFSVFVEMLNLRMRKVKRSPVVLRSRP